MNEFGNFKANSSSPSFTRRQFLKNTALAGAAIVAPSVIPAAALGKNGAVAPSERIVMGGMGLGGRGSGDLNWALTMPDVQVVGVCDVRKVNRDRAKERVDAKYGNKDCAAYIDFRELIARPDIDAIVMAPGDRWHTPMAVRALMAGKDLYCEKPCTMSVAEGQILTNTARKFGRVFQAGMQRRSEAVFVLANELARTGRLGKVHTLRAHTLKFEMRTDALPAETEPAREEIDWDLWLGPSAWRPYNLRYLGGCMAWLNYWDWGTGVAGWCSHTICQCQGAIDADLTAPVEYQYPNNDSAEGFTATYANGVKLVLALNGWRGTCGVRYEGTEGWISVADGYSIPDVSSPALLEDRKKIVHDYMERNQRPMDHMRDFLNCVKSRRQGVTNADVAHKSMTASHIINISMLLKRNVTWDPVKEEFPNDPQANRLRSRAIREPWQV